ncbi:MAG: type III pantothenate kinase [Candidatus Krumholzibacteriia bacterium]
MTVLVLDAGNTRLRAALAADPRQWPGLLPAGAAPRPALDRVGELPTAAAAADAGPWLRELADRHRPDAAVLVSVVPALDPLFAAALPGLRGAGLGCPLPFALDVEDPAAVGADRLCNVTAAAAAGWRRALVVDAGTATTFDLLLDGVFVGGLIAPGMAFAARCLGEAAARLAPVPFGPAPLDAGRSTAAALAAGGWHAGQGGVRHIVAGLRARYGDLPVVVTGGLGGDLADLGHLDPDWTLRGALALAAPLAQR